MAVRYKPHKCSLPDCDRETTNKLYCCPEHRQEGFRRKYIEYLESKKKVCDVCGNEKPLIDFFTGVSLEEFILGQDVMTVYQGKGVNQKRKAY